MPDGVLSRSYPLGHHIGAHVHFEAQLLYASQGIMQVSTPTGRWFVPPDRAVWLPPRIEHYVDVLAGIEMRALLVPPHRLDAHPQAHRLRRTFVVAVGPLLREAILASFETGCDAGLRALLADVALHRLAEAEAPATFMPLPIDPRARRIAELILEDPARAADLATLSAQAGASPRTVSRLFPIETGLTFKAWRQRARIMAALALLEAKRLSMKQIAAKLGFSSVAAFSCAFREIMGQSPSTQRKRRSP